MVSPDQSRSQSNWDIKDLNRKPPETRVNNIQSGAEINYNKQHHSRVPPVSLQVDAKACAGNGGCLTWSYLMHLDMFAHHF